MIATLTGYYGMAQQNDLLTLGQGSVDPAWLSSVSEQLRSAEYDISEVKSARYHWQSPNRAQNLRIKYNNDGFTIEPREVKPSETRWKAVFTNLGAYRLGKQVVDLKKPSYNNKNGNLYVVYNNEMSIEYINNEEGMRHNYYLPERPGGNGNLEIWISLKTDLNVDMRTSGELELFENTNYGRVTKLKYNSLKAWDSKGTVLKSEMRLEQVDDDWYVILEVADFAAHYPITIDPLASTADWQWEPNQADALYGASVATAGDVNNDGYSDVIIGAPSYDKGEVNEGHAFLYLGGPNGISTTPAWEWESDQAYATFGYSVSTAGDVNGDGFTDVIIGAPNFDQLNPDDGKVYLFYGSPDGLDSSIAWTHTGYNLGAQLGSCVATAGDVNDDGYSDVIIGAPGTSNGQASEGMALVFYGTALGLPSSPSWTTEANQSDAIMGYSVSSAGDVNADGYTDILIGAHSYSNGETDEGIVELYLGGPTGLNTSPTWIGECDQAYASYGYSVSFAGDVNGDGYGDVIIGAYGYDNGETNEGIVYLYHGNPTGLNLVPNWSYEPDVASALCGWSVSSAGDYNGDGYADIVIGAKEFTDGNLREGAVFVFSGSVTGIGSTPDWSIQGGQDSAFLGFSVACAGDVNGDGFGDILVGANLFDNGQTDEGIVYCFHGSADLLDNNVVSIIDGDTDDAMVGVSITTTGDVNGDGYADLICGSPFVTNGSSDEGMVCLYYGTPSGMNTVADWSYEPDQVDAFLGNSVAYAGDINGDGYGDIIVGAPGYDNGNTDEGILYLFLGSSTGFPSTPDWSYEVNTDNAELGTTVAGAGDLNGDGYTDIVASAPGLVTASGTGRVMVFFGSSTGFASTPDWTLDCTNSTASWGTALSSAGDINGDGISDLLIGSPEYDSSYTDEGMVMAFYGSTTGLGTTADWIGLGGQAGALYGYAVANAGDVNSDGYADVIIGAPSYDNGTTDEGVAMVYLGTSSGLSASYTWLGESDQTGAEYGYSVGCAGDVNADGHFDIIVGSPSYTNGTTNEGAVFVHLGTTSGINSTVYWTAEGEQANCRYGEAVTAAGDMNGDAFDDIAVTATLYDDTNTDEGRIHFYLGNGGSALQSNVKLYRSDLTTPAVDNTHAGVGSNTFGIGLVSHSALGRVKARLVWETAPSGQPFKGTPVGNSVEVSATAPSFTDLSTVGMELKEVVEKVKGTGGATRTKIRVRLEYDPATMLNGQKYSRWYYIGSTAGDGIGVLPIVYSYFHSKALTMGVVRNTWATSVETSNSHWEVQHSTNGVNWATVGIVDGWGTTSELNTYEFIHKGAFSGYNFYRLKQLDWDATYSYSTINVVYFDSPDEPITVYPIPSTGTVFVTGTFKAESIAVRNLNGQTVKEEVLDGKITRAELDVSDLPTGSYMVDIIYSDSRVTRQLIIH